MTLGRELRALNGKEMTLGHKWKMIVGWELWALNGKEITPSIMADSGSRALGYKWKRNEFGS